ncbi:lysine-2,3-aminomutase-like protein [Candidatus Liberibacter americanus]|uniref:Lysine 2,3-aminomutase n=1 Tax=Candidatus Liberibacter americanus str. Sao Paulo TaxID=1261131 RepID=U6B5K1_9HYPH|nr:lysine-2,3-aminomutase-like protein [Candidatus Liberibacter americanus]AHA28058.1 Lysine 2,3-aminomutase [Candidatus Liberibacter americanus str. Sao Paulo]EMS35972.1 L-lysine 2,3-aminomutase protein [Candidatus Liberibacter americanus PW_SP]
MNSQNRKLSSVKELYEANLIDKKQLDELQKVSDKYSVGLTSTIFNLINPDNPIDPIARQFIPRIEEMNRLPEEREDPIGDISHSPVKGIVHRYPDRVLLKILHICPVYCRFCFRREIVGSQNSGVLSPDDMEYALSYIEENTQIWEVILTGGDPLILSLNRLQAVLKRLRDITHVKILRFHSRVPIVDPQRISDDLVKFLKELGKPIYIAIHANHPCEFSKEALSAISRLVDAGIILLSQSVLLKGVNDNSEILSNLMKIFVESRIKPYYLHHPDLAPGTSHFRLTIEEGQKIFLELKEKISGLCQPSYILDIPGGYGKIKIDSCNIKKKEDGSYLITDHNNIIHQYPPISASINKITK